MARGAHGSRGTGGFTFVEVLAALLFLAIAVPVIVGALEISNRASVAAERGSIAGELAENKLGEFLVDNAWQSSASTSGTFDDHPGFRWEMTTNNWTADTTNPMTELVVEVFYSVQGADHSVRLTTLVYVPPTTTTTGGTSQ